MNRLRLYLKPITLFLVFTLLFQVLFPVGLFALTSGPKSPEFSTFEPVATTEMVNPFTGDFTYNLPVLDVPGPDGGGYSMSLSYHSGANLEQEASWVGFGWTLNPGSLNRNLRGLPDDYYNKTVTKYNRTRPNWTAGLVVSNGISGVLEIFGKDLPLPKGSASLSQTFTINNHTGYSRSSGFNIGLSFIGFHLNMNIDKDGVTFPVGFNPVEGLVDIVKHENQKEKKENGEEKSEKEKLEQAHADRIQNRIESKISRYGLYTYSEPVRTTTFNYFEGSAYNASLSIKATPFPVPIGVELGFMGSFNYQDYENETNYFSFGYMNNPSNNDYPTNDLINQGNNENKVLSDYYTEKLNPYQKRTYFIGVPFNNADHFVAQGEALSGSFRYFPNSVGHFYPNMGQSKINTYNLGLEFSAGDNMGIGMDLGFGWQYIQSKRWNNEGNTAQYQFGRGKKGMFKFNNDLGGKLEYSNNTMKQAGTVDDTSSDPKVIVSNSIKPQLASTEVGRSSYIEYYSTLLKIRES